MKKITWALLAFFCALSLFLNLYKRDSAPGFTADEAAFGYNAYSILKTEKDEYGAQLPLRLKSFGDYKMPVYSYLSIPFIGTMGLNEQSARALNSLLALLFPFTVFLLARELFGKEEVGLVAAFLTAITLGLHIVGRQAHEAYLAAFLITLSTYFFVKELRNKKLFISPLLMLVALFTYQSSRIFALFFLLAAALYTFRKKLSSKILIGMVAVFLIFSLTDFFYKPERVKNLLFFNNQGFALKINELRGEGGARVAYNKLTVGVHDLSFEYLKYFSPQFLVTDGDENPRFGYPGMSLISPLIYLLFLTGLFYLFKNNEKHRYLLIGLLLISPVPAFLTWAGISLTRSFFILIPVLVISSYGVVNLFKNTKRNNLLVPTLLIIHLFFLFYSWDFYLNHYPKRALVVRAWEAGYKELGNYVRENYDRLDKFYITKSNGQPYMHLLFQLDYPPEKFQKQAVLSAPDIYGFGTVEKFDKFEFNFRYDPMLRNTAHIGSPHDFDQTGVDESKVKKITVNGQEIFWIFEN